MAAAAWGDEAFDALRRMLAQVDAGKNVDEVLDDVQDMGDLSRRIGFGKKKKKGSWMTPEQEAAYRMAADQQRESASRFRQREEMLDIEDMLKEAEDEEKFLIFLRSQGLL
jgi:hypothetical protein